jgi:hypothetical protein
MVKRVQRNLAPPGYIAVVRTSHPCTGCAFFNAGPGGEAACRETPCLARQRPDGRNVIFVKRPVAKITGKHRRVAGRIEQILKMHLDLRDLLANCEDERSTGQRPDPYGRVLLTRETLSLMRRLNFRLGDAVGRLLTD